MVLFSEAADYNKKLKENTGFLLIDREKTGEKLPASMSKGNFCIPNPQQVAPLLP